MASPLMTQARTTTEETNQPSLARGTKMVYAFGPDRCDGDGTMKQLLGGKGANLAEMCTIGLPVPAG